MGAVAQHAAALARDEIAQGMHEVDTGVQAREVAQRGEPPEGVRTE